MLQRYRAGGQAVCPGGPSPARLPAEASARATLAGVDEESPARRDLPARSVRDRDLVGPGDDAAVVGASPPARSSRRPTRWSGAGLARRLVDRCRRGASRPSAQNLADVAAMGAAPTSLLVHSSPTPPPGRTGRSSSRADAGARPAGRRRRSSGATCPRRQPEPSSSRSPRWATCADGARVRSVRARATSSGDIVAGPGRLALGADRPPGRTSSADAGAGRGGRRRARAGSGRSRRPDALPPGPGRRGGSARARRPRRHAMIDVSRRPAHRPGPGRCRQRRASRPRRGGRSAALRPPGRVTPRCGGRGTAPGALRRGGALAGRASSRATGRCPMPGTPAPTGSASPGT